MMNLPSRFFHLGIHKKLVLINLLIFIVFTSIVVYYFLSFHDMETLVSGSIVLLLGLFAIFFSYRNIRRPMKQILQGIESIRNGDLETRIQLNRSDEWSDIEDALNGMIGNLKASYSQLKRTNKELETAQSDLCHKIMELETEIVERKRVEEALRESERRLEATIQGSPIPIFVVGKDRKIIYWNKALEELSGIRAAGVIGTTRAWEAFYREERPVLANLLATGDTTGVEELFPGKYRRSALLEEGYEITEFYPHLGESGKWLHSTSAPLRDTRGELFGAIEIAEDLTDRILAEEKWHSLYYNLPGGSFTVNDRYIIEDVNDVLCSVTGYKKEELVGQKCGIICPKGPHKCPIFDLGKERIDNDETSVKGKDGRLVPIIKSARRVPSGKREMIIENFQDITDRRKLEEQLRHAQKMEAIGQLAGGVAHDFNNILTAIIGFANLLQMKMENRDPLARFVDQIMYSAERAANLTGSLLAFGRKQVLELRPVSINESIRKAETLLSRLVREDIVIRAVTGADCVIMADTIQIEQILMNLVTNARDAMPEGGLIVIGTERVELDEEFVRTNGYETPGTFVVVSVSDTGEGMDANIRERIFEPFFTTKETGKGTGLGLSIVYGIVKQHKGYINVYSEIGKGTTFRIYLPVICDDSEGLEIREATDLPRGSETILLAEDEPTVRNLTGTVLEEFGYQVIVAEDGITAVEKFKENGDRISLLVTDVIMPGKNGREVCNELRKIRPDLKVLFMSGYSGDILNRNGVLEENLNFISKPITNSVLLCKVRDLLDCNT
jgi:two-component system cell cycle sensor histidine kinase/response regulator CckA